MTGVLLRGISGREYGEVLPDVPETAGVARSSVSRHAIEGRVEQLRRLRARRWKEADLLVLSIDRQHFGSHHVLSAVSVDRVGTKHVLGIEVGATKNAEGGKAAIHAPARPGPADGPQISVRQWRRKSALRVTIEEVLGSDQPVQRCRNHKMRNVLDEFTGRATTASVELDADRWHLSDAEEGMKRLEQLARFLEHEHESVVRSLCEGMVEMFTVQRLQPPPSLFKCLGITNVAGSPAKRQENPQRDSLADRRNGRALGRISVVTH